MAAWLALVLAGCSVSFMGGAVLAPRILAEAGLPRETVGLYAGLVWTMALVASQSSASLVRRFGPWTVVRLCLVGCVAGLLAMVSGQPLLLLAGALLIGFGQGLEAPPSSQLLVHHVPAARRPFIFSLKQTGVQFGAVIASLGLPALALALGWRWALLAVCLTLTVLLVVLGGAARRHGGPPRMEGAGPGLRHAVWSWIGLLQRRPGLRRLGLAASTFGATQVCVNSFLVTWMVAVREVPLTTAGALAATAQGAGLIGRPLWGWVASRAGGGSRVLRGLGVVMALCALAMGLAGASLPGPALALLAAVFGLSASGWNGVFLSEVAVHGEGEEIAAATAATMVPLYLGLIAGPVAFAAISRSVDLSAGFLGLAVVAGIGSLLVPAARR